MSNRNARPGKLVLLLAAFAFLTSCQPGTADIENIRRRAEAGDSASQYNLGGRHLHGYGGVPQDIREAVKWYRKAAAQGHAAAQHSLGLMYAKGEGVPEDHREAVKWYRKAANQGHAEAQFKLGKMYAAAGRGLAGWKPEGVPAQNLPKALKWLRLAAEQGHAEAQYSLGHMYNIGLGVPEDHREAVKWFRLAADQGHASSQSSLGGSYARGEGVPQDYRSAVQWFRLAAEQGHAWGQHSLGLSYAKGEGVPQDYVKAHAWLNLAATHKFRVGTSGMPFAKIRDRLAAQMTTAQIADAQKLAAELHKRIETSKSR